LNQNKKNLYMFSVIFISLLNSGCNSNSPTEVVKLVSTSEREFGELEISNIKNLTVENRIGGILLNGIDYDVPMEYYLYKTVRAETIIKGQERFDEILLESNAENDTINYFISSPDSSAYYVSYCSLSLDILNDITCVVNSPNRGVFTSYLDTTLTVFNSTGKIEVLKHTGSCDVKTSVGDVLIEMILPENGYCRAFSASGNVKLEIHNTASAIISAKAENGSIIFYNLEISDLEQSNGSLSGKLGSGAGEIYLETKSGDIEIVGFN
jgi:hypothetical protein